MIELLRIKDLALIEDVEIELTQGLNVLTGETGAGKSFILKALNFLTGEKLTVDLVRPNKEKAVVEAMFFLNGEECIIRRELLADTGRSRFYVNGQLSSQEAVRDMRASLLLHTSQHGQHKLLSSTYQAQILDDFAANPSLFAKKEEILQNLAGLERKKRDLAEQARLLEEKRDVLEFQNDEIAKVNPKQGEEEELEARRERFRNQSGIVSGLEQAMQSLHGAEGATGLYGQLGNFERALHALAKYAEEFATSSEILLEIKSHLQDIEKRLRSLVLHKEDERSLESIEERLYAIAQLKRKLRRPLGDILSLQKEIQDNLNFLDNCKLEEKQITLQQEEHAESLANVLGAINPLRKKAALELAEALEAELRGLGFSEHVKVIFAFTPHVLYQGREDCTELRAKLLWQPNPGQAEQPLDKIASGGELSRFLLALVSLMARKNDENPTLIFDEVDAGVGGVTLNRVAESIAKLACERQILLITHWPHLAKHARRHFVVQKIVSAGQTFTTCKQLTAGEIPDELARMAGMG